MVMCFSPLCLSRKGGGQQGCQQSCRRQQGEQMSSAVLFHTRGVLLILYLPGHVPWHGILMVTRVRLASHLIFSLFTKFFSAMTLPAGFHFPISML